MSQMYKYDAFISYRHLPQDEAVAARVQNLLERYRPPKGVCGDANARIGRIFRDGSELSASSDLGQSLRNALFSSRYLIIILSEETKHSKWCMEEIRQFKAAHGGSIHNILPVLVSGEPSASIPELLRFETQTDALGRTFTVEVEPLCCDVRAETLKDSLKKLKKEYLRLAAPLLDCSYDDLYQRHKRRARQQKLAASFGVTAAALLLGVLGYSSYVSYRTFQMNLKNSYLQQGSDAVGSDVQRSLTYFSNALALDKTSQAAETGTLMLLQQNNWLKHSDEQKDAPINPPSMPQWGQLWDTAKDNSCYTYYDGTDVTFYFPESGNFWQVTVPANINPRCNVESVIDSRPYAMAISESRVVIRNNGYLYLYDLSADGGVSLFKEFDLALVFKEETAKDNLDLWNETWVDTGGKLAVLYNGASAAVINVANKENPCLNEVHTVYGYGLSNVAFSQDGEYYALVYGNDYGIDLYDPGGYVEVYDEYGNRIMSTPSDPTMAPEDAAFEPDGSRLLVWGSSTLQVWDLTTGAPAAAPIQLPKITGAFWTADGCIAVSNDSGKLQIYTPMQFTPATSAPEITQPAEEVDVYAENIQLIDGYWLNHNYSKIWLTDERRNPVGEEIIHQINKMYALPDGDVAYFWYDNSDTLLRVTVKEDRSGLAAEELDAMGLSITDLRIVPGGMVAFTGNEGMLYYPLGSTTPLHSMVLGSNGNIKEASASDTGLFAVVIQATEHYSSDSHRYESLYSLELWDLNSGLCVARPETDSSKRPQALTLTEDGWMLYEKSGKLYQYLVNIANADSAAADFLCSIPCWTIEGEDAPVLQISEYDSSNSGSWQAALAAAPYAPEEKTLSAAESIIQEMNTILDSQGTDAWLDKYNTFWNTRAADTLSLAEMEDMFRDYVRTARSLDRMEELQPGFTCMTNALIADGGEDWVTQYGFVVQTMQYMLQTKAYDDIMIDYWLRMADAAEANFDYESEDWFYDFAGVYENRLYAYLLQGYGVESFYYAIDEVYWDSLAQILVDSTLDKLYYMVKGKPESAASSYNQYLDQLRELYSYDPEECREEIETSVMLTLLDFHMLEQRGLITEADLNTFVENLSVTVGLELAQVTPENLANGLYLGDVVIAVGGTRVFNQYHMAELQKAYPTASLTVKRAEQIFTTDILENWHISGDFYAQ